MFSFSECFSWLAVGLTECVAIEALNIITIIVFIKTRNLRKRSTFLVINLAVVDMLVGVIAPYELFFMVGVECNVWKNNLLTGDWASYVLVAFILLFAVSSITTITAIAIDRLHATLRPFSHRRLEKLVYGLIIAVIWVTAVLLTIPCLVLFKFKGYSYTVYLWNSYFAICLLVLCVSYACIVIKVRCGAQLQHHGAASRERKLTMTLFIVTVVSLLVYLPDVVFHFFEHATDIVSSLSVVTFTRLHNALSVLCYANSLVNPILYAIRMPEYRSAVLALFHRRPRQQRQVEVLSLHNDIGSG